MRTDAPCQDKVYLSANGPLGFSTWSCKFLPTGNCRFDDCSCSPLGSGYVGKVGNYVDPADGVTLLGPVCFHGEDPDKYCLVRDKPPEGAADCTEAARSATGAEWQLRRA